MVYKKTSYYSVPGFRVKDTYSPKVSKSGSVHLVKSGEVDIYDEIQSHKQSVDLKSLIARFELGEVDVLNRRSGFFADITGLPKTYAEMHQLMTDARSHFDALPVDIRRKYDFDFGKYLSALGNISSESVSQDPVQAPEKTDVESEVESK